MEIKKIDLDHTSPKQSREAKQTLDTSTQNIMPTSKQSIIPVVILFVLVAVAGFYTGSAIKQSSGPDSAETGVTANIQQQIPEAGVKVGDVYGSPDEKTFRDKSTGVVEKGGLNGEGTHKLVRPGGATKTVYMTSTVIDLDTLVGHQVTVWGETNNGQKVGWLMDVGRIKVEALNVPLPQ